MIVKIMMVLSVFSLPIFIISLIIGIIYNYKKKRLIKTIGDNYWDNEEYKVLNKKHKKAGIICGISIAVFLVGLVASSSDMKEKIKAEKQAMLQLEQKEKENVENNELTVVEEKDGFVTYSDGSVIKETIGGTFKWTAAYKEIENKEKKMDREEQCDILGKNELIILEEKILDEKKIKEVVTIARECGLNPHMSNGSYWSGENQIYIVRVKKGMLTDDIQYGVKFNEVADIRNANPDTVVKEMENTIKTLAKKMPDYVQIELHKRTPESYKPIGELKEIVPGQISEISLTYYKKSNIITKIVTVKREPAENKVKGAIYVLYDVVK